MGYEPQVWAGNFVVIDYRVELGPLRGEIVKLGFQDPSGFPAACPGGPCISPQVLPLNTSTSEPPLGGVHNFVPPGGSDQPWEYWSRPYPGWSAGMGVAEYFQHIRHLLDEVPADAVQRRPHL
ncbi:MAG: hypothetical protein ACYCX3_01475 [Thermoleophilia bacterium]